MDGSILIDLKDVCIRMQEAWNIRATVLLDVRNNAIKGKYAGVCVTRRDIGTGFPVLIDARLKRERRIWVLAHELRHVMQRLSGDLRGQDTWKGSRVDRTSLKYNDLPWEVDANAWADAHAPTFYANNRPSITIPGRSLGDIPWGR